MVVTRYLIRQGALVCLLVTLFAPELWADPDNDVEDVLRGSLLSEVGIETPVFVPENGDPQTTVQSFQEQTRKIRDLFVQHPEGIDGEVEDDLIELFARGTYLIDVSDLPKADRFTRAHVAICQLSEVLDRIPLPPIEQVPDAEATQTQKLDFWRIPGTGIALSRIQEGPRKDEWIFSKETVEQLDRLYHKLRKKPYREDANIGAATPDGGLLNSYVQFTGPLLPSNFDLWMPPSLRVVFFGEPLWKYLGTLIILVAASLFGYLILRVKRRLMGRNSQQARPVLTAVCHLIMPVSIAVMLLLVSAFVTFEIRLRMTPLTVTNDILLTLFYFVVFWGVVCLGNLIGTLIIAHESISSTGLDASLVKLATRVSSYILGFWVLVEGVQRLGLSLVPLIAGVSIGGLAFAMAARPTLGNMLAGILIFADRPFKVGDRVMVGVHNGTIEDIGLHSTRIRTLEGHLASVPNEYVCSNDVINIARRPSIRRKTEIGITYNTPPEKIEEAMQIIRDILSQNTDGGKNDEELGRPGNHYIYDGVKPPRVEFTELGESSLNIMVLYYFNPPDMPTYQKHCTWVNLELVKRFNAAGIEFAFPTQTIELAGETTLPESNKAQE